MTDKQEPDIVERLRAYPADPMMCDDYSAAMLDAADKIAALEADARIKAANLELAQTRVAELEAALKTLLSAKDTEIRLKQLHEMGYGTDYDQHRSHFARAWDAARAAMKDHHD